MSEPEMEIVWPGVTVPDRPLSLSNTLYIRTRDGVSAFSATSCLFSPLTSARRAFTAPRTNNPSASDGNDGSAEKFLWNPEGGYRDLDYQRILTRPVIFEDYCSAIGSKGDILLIDPSQYILLTKGTARMGWSIHVQWLTDQQCFRMVFRCGGAPKQNAPITLANSSNTRSAFVTLAARA